MKVISIILSIIIIHSLGWSQKVEVPQKPVLVASPNHDPDYLKKVDHLTAGSFYQSKEDWQAIIDSTWGPGLEIGLKLRIFDTYTDALDNEFDGFISLGMSEASWKSLRNSYRAQINDSTSQGRFCAIMNYLSNGLRDLHTMAFDTVVINSSLNPGIPFLIGIGFLSVQHFGAITTTLPDCTALILRVVDNHPLELQPGDIILGYEGIPYPDLLGELLEAELPGFLPHDGAKSAEDHHYYQNAGMNWHLFETIDILQYASGDTLHLPVEPMINLDVPYMLNNEQMEIPNIPFPDYLNGQLVSYGIVENTNIGYIYLYSESSGAVPSPDEQFFEAVNALKNTEGLIIDMRWNEGGWAFFDEACKILFNSSPKTLNGAFRCNQESFDLCPFDDTGYIELHQIKSKPNSIYDHPIALLLGPTCVSMGDRTAHRLSYHPMAKSFGKPPAASFGLNIFIENFPDWFLRYSIEDMYDLNQPETYLNRSEFPIDFPVWFSPDDVAKGEDTIVKSALNWMDNLAYAHDVTVSHTYAKPGIDSVKILTIVENPNFHQLSIQAKLHSIDSVLIDSLGLFDDGLHGDYAAGDNIWGNFYLPAMEQTYKVTVITDDLTDETSLTLPNAVLFTSLGPLAYAGMTFNILYDSTFHAGNQVRFKMHLKNESSEATASEILARLESPTPILTLGEAEFGFPDIAPGTSEESYGYFQIEDIESTIDPDTTLYLPLTISLHTFPIWYDSILIDVISVIGDVSFLIPKEFALQQNYPNPFNPKTIINYHLPITNSVELSIYNIRGQKISTLISEKQNPKYHQVEWDASAFASGVYYYMIKSGEFHDVKKMILLR